MLSYLIQGTDEALYVGTGLLQRYYHFMANALDENVGSIQLLCSVTGLWGTLGLLHQLQNPDVLAKWLWKPYIKRTRRYFLELSHILVLARILAEKLPSPPCTCLGLSCSANLMSNITVAARTVHWCGHPLTEAPRCVHRERPGDGGRESNWIQLIVMRKACPSQGRIQLGGRRNMDDTGRAPGHLGLPLLARIKVLCIRTGCNHKGREICSQVALIPPPLYSAQQGTD